VSPSGTLGEVFFEQGSSELREKQREDIQEMAARLKGEFRDCNGVVVLGYASRDGDDAENKYLAEKRAKVVANELKALGIPQKKVIAQSEGELNQGRDDRDLPQDRKATVTVYRNL
jgi:outer membrane protein OmpA-like peptidoglycan-associated protein